MPWALRYYERTCDECGYAWPVPRAIAKPKRTMAATGGVVSVGIGNVGGIPGGLGSALRDRAMIEKVERNLRSATAGAHQAAEDLARCAQCGSEEYSQRPLRP